MSDPLSYPSRLTQLEKDDLRCRLRSGTPRTVETEPVQDLSLDDEVNALVERHLKIYAPLDVDTPASRRAAKTPELAERILEVESIFKQYDDQCRAEYANITDEHLRAEFEGLARKNQIEPWEYYRRLRKYFFRRGIDNPHDEINKVRPGQRFLDRNVGGAHSDLITILKGAEDRLRAAGRYAEVRDAIVSAYCFVPRPKNTLVGLTPHALGRAIDVNAARNPHLQGATATAIDAILDWQSRNGQGNEWRVTSSIENMDLSIMDDAAITLMVYRIQKISASLQLFLETYLDSWLAGESRGIPGETEAAPLLLELLKRMGAVSVDKRGHRTVDKKKLAEVMRIRRDGIIELPVALFQAIIAAGGHSGIEFSSAKDSMHFEARPAIPDRSLPPCLAKKKR